MPNHDTSEKVFTPTRQEARRAELNTLSEQFDTLLKRMQSPKARRGMAAAFHADKKQMGKPQLLLLANVPWSLRQMGPTNSGK